MISETHQELLLDLAEKAIHHGLKNGGHMPIDLETFPEELRLHRACFVTLNLSGRLRGCIGSLNAYQPLASNVAENAYNAAFRDPRFSPLTPLEASRLEIHIAVLGELQSMQFGSESELASQLLAGSDGLVLSEGPRRGTFLPSVWEVFPDPKDFLSHLKQKAGLPADYWSNEIRVQRYHVHEFSRAH